MPTAGNCQAVSTSKTPLYPRLDAISPAAREAGRFNSHFSQQDLKITKKNVFSFLSSAILTLWRKIRF